MFDQLLKALGGSNLGDIEKNAGDLFTRLEKLGADVIGSNGNVLAAVVAVAEDFATIKQVVSDLTTIVSDLKAMHSAAVAAPTIVAQTSATNPVPQGTFAAALSAVEQIAHVAAGGDPFQAKPLAKPSQVVEPHGGA